jgi:hypothetical protein
MAQQKNWWGDRFAIAYYNDADEEQWAQTESNIIEARRCREILNDHDIRCGREPMYFVVEIPK